MMQPELFSWTPPVILGDRDGSTFNAKRDGKRLNAQCQAVYNVMADGQWRTLELLGKLVDAPEASVSARLRDLRKPKFGGYDVQRKYVGCGLYQYRLTV